MVDLLFKKVEYYLNKLLEDIAMGEIGLPDIQRPFVWNRAQVRDLFDSMYRGYPVGTLLFWESGLSGRHRKLGLDAKQKSPRLLIIDGQQRLTALYAAMRGVPIVDKNFSKRRLKVAFNPLEERFEVANAAIERNPAWIADISALWAPNTNLLVFSNGYLGGLQAKRGLSQGERGRILDAINKLYTLQQYPFSALEISSNANEEQVSDIFVRINSKGRSLNQADFILTLMSVFWDEGRVALERFAQAAQTPSEDGRPSPYNPYFQPSPDQLLRVVVALAFRRARLTHVYAILRGKDLETGEFSEVVRERQFELLRSAQAYALDLQNWHDFLHVIKLAGYTHKSLILSETALVYNYALWLIGRRDFGVPEPQLRSIIARWFFMTALTGRYTGSSESRMEQDLAMLRGGRGPESFAAALEREIQAVLTPDFWSVTLPNQLESSGARTPAQAAYYAALVLLDAPVLYSHMKVRDLLSSNVQPVRQALERHHLFPRSYLRKLGVEDWLINQVANFTVVEWRDNIEISDRPPSSYAPALEQRFTPEEIERMYHHHALATAWYSMDYNEFLEDRRVRMAEIIKQGYQSLP